MKGLSDDAWFSGAVYYDQRYSGNTKIYTDGITIGKEYLVTDRIIVSHDTVSIINDYGSERYYLSELFISKSEWRQNKLDILLGDKLNEI